MQSYGAARQELDLKVGVAFTRFQTRCHPRDVALGFLIRRTIREPHSETDLMDLLGRYFGGRYRERMRVISYGPCQTPTLGFCVARHIEICEFQPEDYWSLRCAVRKPAAMTDASAASAWLDVSWARKRVFDKGMTGGSTCM